MQAAAPHSALADFCEQLRQLRRATSGLSLSRLACRPGMNLSDSQLSSIERGQIKKLPELDVVLEFVKACAEYTPQLDGRLPVRLMPQYWRETYGAVEKLLDTQQITSHRSDSVVDRRIALAVDPITMEIECMAGATAYIKHWIAEERERLRSMWDLPDQGFRSNVEADVRKRMFDDGVLPDPRTREKYYAQVDDYLVAAKWALETRQILRIETHTPAMISLRVCNPTEWNLTQGRFEVRIPGPVFGITEKWRSSLPLHPPRMPQPPAPPGTTCGPSFESLLWVQGGPRFTGPSPMDVGSRLLSAQLIQRDLDSWTTRSLEEGGVHITFREFDLRPGESHQLPGVPVLVAVPVGTGLLANWAATASNLDGNATGELSIAVVNSTLPPEDPSTVERAPWPPETPSSVLSFATRTKPASTG